MKCYLLIIKLIIQCFPFRCSKYSQSLRIKSCQKCLRQDFQIFIIRIERIAHADQWVIPSHLKLKFSTATEHLTFNSIVTAKKEARGFTLAPEFFPIHFFWFVAPSPHSRILYFLRKFFEGKRGVRKKLFDQVYRKYHCVSNSPCCIRKNLHHISPGRSAAHSNHHELHNNDSALLKIGLWELKASLVSTRSLWMRRFGRLFSAFLSCHLSKFHAIRFRVTRIVCAVKCVYDRF